MDTTEFTAATAEHLARGNAAAQALAAAGVPFTTPTGNSDDPEQQLRNIATWAAHLETELAIHGLDRTAARATPLAPAEVRTRLEELEGRTVELSDELRDRDRTLTELRATLHQREDDLVRLRHHLAAQIRATRTMEDAALAAFDRTLPAPAPAVTAVSAGDTVTAILAEHGPCTRAQIVAHADDEHRGAHSREAIDQALSRGRKNGHIAYNDGLYQLAPNDTVVALRNRQFS